MQISPLSADNRSRPGSEFHFTIPVVVPPSGALVQIGSLSADNRSRPGSEFHFTIPVAVPACGHSGADHHVVSRQSPPAMSRNSISRYLWPIRPMILRRSSPRCQPTIEVGQGPDFHFTIPVAALPSATLVQISPLSADNRSRPGSEFHFTIPLAVRASGYSGADRPVVSRQLRSARGPIFISRYL